MLPHTNRLFWRDLFAAVLLWSACLPMTMAEPVWERLRPLDTNPELDSGEPLARACIPGETVVLREPIIAEGDSRNLASGEFLVCIGTTSSGTLELVDGIARKWQLAADKVNSTQGFPANWVAMDRDYLVWAYNRDTLVIRESLVNSFEGNFLYLLLDRDDQGQVSDGLLIDSGTGLVDLEPYILSVMADKPLTIISTHSHWDHFGGHRHFMDNPQVRLLGYQPGNVYNPYPKPPEYDIDGLEQAAGITRWPSGQGQLQIGTRAITVLPTPGHTGDSISLYDVREQLMFTGDMVCPCLQFIELWPEFTESLNRLENFAEQHPVKWFLGSHIEMSRKKSWNQQHEYFYFGSNYHWDEMPLQMDLSDVTAIHQQVASVLVEAEGEGPVYTSDTNDRPFQPLPSLPIAFPGIPSYFREDSARLVNRIVEHQKHLDEARRQKQQDEEAGDS